jgi:hypothetical protein
MIQNVPAAQVLLSELCERADHGLVPKKFKKATTGKIRTKSHFYECSNQYRSSGGALSAHSAKTTEAP